MKITKYGHCCLLIEDKGVRIITDPGVYSTGFEDLTDIDLILISHEHADHIHTDSLKKLLTLNPNAQVVTNLSVGELLKNAEMLFKTVENGQSYTYKDVLIESFDAPHALVHKSIPQVQNTAYFISERLFYPGDAFINPSKPVEILALPVAGPWLKLSDAIDYGLEINPKHCFPVHDGNLKEAGTAHALPGKVLGQAGIKFVVLEEGPQ